MHLDSGKASKNICTLSTEEDVLQHKYKQTAHCLKGEMSADVCLTFVILGVEAFGGMNF